MNIYFHIGLTKTASTAIQKFLYKNSLTLRKNGYFYCDKNSSFENGVFTTSGNAYDLYLGIKEKSTNGVELENFIFNWLNLQVIESKKNSCENLIISSESFCSLDEHEFLEIFSAISRLKCNCKFLLIKRNPYDWAFSSWLQVVKREGYNKWFNESVFENINYSLKPLCVEKNFVGFQDNFVVINFEDHRKDIIRSFLRCIDISDDIICNEFTFFVDEVNQSLSRPQFIAHYFSNKYTNKNTKISEIMFFDLYKNKNSNSFVFYCEAVDKKISSYCYVNDINYSGVNKDSKIQYESEFDFIGDLTEDERVYVSAIEILSRYSSCNLKNALNLAIHKVNLYQSSDFKKLVPEKFNLFTYLLLNEDVLFEAIDPYRHYIEYGINDKRDYFIDNS